MNNKPISTRFLTVDLNRLAYGAGCGLAGGVIAGAFSRFSMRAVALLIGQKPEFSLGGTVGILVIFGAAGIIFGLVYTAVVRYLPVSPVLGGWLYGALLMGLAAIPLFRADLDGELALVPPLTILTVFAPVFLSYGGILGMASRKLQPWLAAATPRPVGIVSLILINAFLFLGVLSIPSLGEFSLPFPRAIVRMYPILGLTYNTTHNLRGLLVFGFGLVYLGASGLIYLRSGRSWMAKFTAFALLAFAGAFFNSRDVIAAAFFGFPQAPILSGLLRAVGYSLFLLLLYIFPDGRFTPRWTLPLAILFSVWGAVWSLDLWPSEAWSPAAWPQAVQLGVFFGSLGTGCSGTDPSVQAIFIGQRSHQVGCDKLHPRSERRGSDLAGNPGKPRTESGRQPTPPADVCLCLCAVPGAVGTDPAEHHPRDSPERPVDRSRNQDRMMANWPNKPSTSISAIRLALRQR